MQALTERRRHAVRLLRGIAWLALACYVLYLAAGNAFLNSRLGRDTLNRRPEAFAMQWAGGHTLWPGRVTLREVHVRGQARRVRWSAQADAVRGRIALLPLLRKELRMPWIEADGVTGSVLRADSDRPAAPPRPRPGGWTLDLERIGSASLRGVALGDWRIAGDGRAEVGFRKQLRGGPMELRPSSLAFAAARVDKGDVQWLSDVRMATTFALPRSLPAGHPGVAGLDLLKASLELQGTTVQLRSTLDAAGRYAFAVLPGDGQVRARLSLDRGALAAGDHLQLQLPLTDVDAQGVAVANRLDLRFAVDQAMHLRVSLPDRDGRHLSLDAALDLPGNTLPLKDWRTRLSAASGTVRAHGHLPSIGGVVALFTRADWMDLEGSGTVDADLRLAGGQLTAGSRLRVSEVEARADVLGNRFRGKARAEATIGTDAGGNPQSRLDLTMESFGAAPSTHPGKPYFTGERLRLETVSDARFERMQQTMQARVRFERARIPELAVFNPYLPNATLRFAGGSGTLSGDLSLDGAGEVGRGRLRVDGRQVRLALAGIDLRGDVAVDARLRRGNLRKGEFELDDSSASVRNVAFTEPGGATRSGWWASLDIDSGRAEWKRPSSAGGQVQVRMRDIGFLLAMFADRADLPSWTGRVVDAGEARLRGKWLWQGDRLVLDQARAQNERFTVDARMALEERRKRGDLYLQWGVLGVGVQLDGASRQFHLRRAREWYDGRPHLLR